MNEEKYVLAELKRWLADEIERVDKYESRRNTIVDVAAFLLAAEANATLGEDPDEDLAAEEEA